MYCRAAAVIMYLMLIIDHETPWSQVLEAIACFHPDVHSAQGCTEQQILEYEQELGHRLMSTYRSFLQCLGHRGILPANSRYDDFDFRMQQVRFALERGTWSQPPTGSILIGVGPVTLGCGGEENVEEAYLHETGKILSDRTEISQSLQAWYFQKAWTHWHLQGFAREVSLYWDNADKSADIAAGLIRQGYQSIDTRLPTMRFYGYQLKADAALLQNEATCSLKLRARTPATAQRLVEMLQSAFGGRLSVWRDASGPI